MKFSVNLNVIVI